MTIKQSILWKWYRKGLSEKNFLINSDKEFMETNSIISKLQTLLINTAKTNAFPTRNGYNFQGI